MTARRLTFVLSLLALSAVTYTARADSYTLVLAGGLWSNNLTWLQNGLPALRTPGSLVGTTDTVALTAAFYTVSMDTALVQPVTVTTTCPSNTSTCVLDVTTGSLALTGASNIGTDARLKISGGTITNGGTLTLASASKLDWSSGTLTGAGTTAVSAGASVNATGTGAMTLSGQHVDNQGTFTVDAGSPLSIDSGGHVTNAAGAFLQLQGDVTINSDGVSNPRIDNAGTLQKLAGSGSAVLNVSVNNTNNVAASVGNILFANGGTHTGTFTGCAGCFIELVSGTHTLDGATFSAATKLLGATATVTANGATMSNGFFFGSGTIDGPGVLTLSNAFTWSGGTMTGTGKTLLSGTTPAVTLDGNSGVMVLSGRKLVNSRTLNYTLTGANRLSINSGGQLENAGTFAINGDFAINSDQLGGAVFTNDGGASLTKTAGGGYSRIAAKVDNLGTVTISSGQLAFNGGGTNGGGINIPNATNVLAFEDKVYSLTIGTIFGVNDLGVVRVDGASAVLTMSTSLGINKVELNAGRIVASSLTFNKSLLWTGGTLQGPGTFTLAPLAIAATSSPVSTLTLDNCTFDNNGTFTYDAAQNLIVTNTSTFNNKSGATFNYKGDGRVAGGSGTNAFTNDGLVQKTAGFGESDFYLTYVNQGTAITSSDISGGSVAFGAGGSMSGGTLRTTTASATLDFDGATFTVTGGTITGSGKAKVDGATLQVNANASATTTLEVETGVLDVSSPNTFQITTLEWNGGTIQGSGTKRVFAGSISATAPTTLTGSGTLTLPAAAFSYDADNVNHLTINGTAKLNVESGGAMTITGNGIIDGAATARVSSTGGTLTKSGASTARIDVPLDFTSGSGGTINVSAGTLELGGGGTIAGSAGSLQITSGATLTSVSGTLDVNASATLSGTGTLRINGGTVNLNTPATLANLILDAGALGGTANVTLDGGKWTGGDMNGTGTTRVSSGKSFELATGTAKKLRRNFTNDGTFFSQNLPAALTLENAAVLTNNSLVELQENTNFFCTCTPTPARFHNSAGAILRTLNASGTSNFLTVVDNDGTVDVQTGILNFLNGGTHTGAFTAATNTYLQFAGAADSFSPTATITGDGQVGFNATSSTFAGTHTLTGNGQTIVEGNVSFTSASTINTAALNLRSGSIGGTSNVAITGGSSPNYWESGTIQGTGSFTLAAGATMAFDAATGPITLDGRTFTNNGTIVYPATGNALTLTNGATLANAGTFDIQDDAPVNAGPGTNAFTNSGTFQKTAGAGTTNFAVPFTTSNAVNLASGTVSFSGGFTQSAGTTTLNAGNFASPLAININGGTLKGNGSITGNVSNAANVSPGLSPGGLTITGNYTQSPAGILNIELAGTTAVTNYDQLNVSGTATLNGMLNATLIGGFVPANNDIFDVLTYGASSGTFATENLPAFTGGGTFTANQGAARYRLTAHATQADVAVSQTTSGPAFHAQNATFTVTVSNSGPDAANGVTLTDTMSGATLVTAMSTIGTCGNGSPIVCTIGTLATNQSAVVTITVNASNVGTIANSATVSSTDFDPNSGNNATGTASIVVSASADLSASVTDSADPVNVGASTSYTVTINNAGPDSASSASVALTLTNGAIVSTTTAAFSCSGNATNQTCTAATLAPGSYLISVNVQAPAATGTMSLKAHASSATGDPNTANDADIENTAIGVTTDVSITKTGPSVVAAGGNAVYTITVTNNGTADATGVIVSDPTPAHVTFVSTSGACTTAFPCALGTLNAGQSKTITATYTASNNRANEGRTIVNVASVTSNAVDPVSANNQASAQTTIACQNEAPDHLAPAGGITVSSDGALTWQGNGQSYMVYLGPAGNGCSMQFGTSATESLAYSGLTAGAAYEWRVVSDRGQCAVQSSACVTFKVENKCTRPETPLARVVGQQTSGKTYSVEWDAIPGATRYEIDEATNAQFTDATTTVVQGLAKSFKHDVTVSTAFYYRVRAFNDCGADRSADSPTVRVVIVPLPSNDKPGRNVNIPAGSQELVVQRVFIPGEANQSLFFSATTDRPWLTVHPSSGALPPQGVTVDVTADPATLPNGTFTATLIVTVTGGSSVRTNGVTSVVVPVSINLVTPVSPVASKDAASQYAMVIPSIGHLDGINSFWQSDVRVTNAGFRPYRYKLTFTPTGGTAAGVKQTTITVDAGATTALDDIVRNWYGFGALGDNASGMLEILPLDEPAAASAATVASSRTYNVTDNGTLGQFIPAVRFNQFIGQAVNGGLASILSLQQVAESTAYRTNLGIAEASGNAASVLLSVFNGSGTKLLTLPLQLAAGEQRQLNSFLAQNNITLPDGRIEVQVAGGGGKVTAYASVIDNNTRDPLLVSGTLLNQPAAAKWVLPGVANIDNPVAHWRTDMRVFNYGTSVQPATLTFFPGGNGAPKSVNVDLQPGAVLTLDDVLASKFSLTNAGGVVHLTTGAPSSIVVTGRTYNQTANGTFGQFIPAVTPQEAVAAGGPTLHILQVEDSTRYRTNIGLAEVSGAPAIVEVQVILPDSKFTPTVQIPLAANEFRQFSLIRDLALGNVYNARVTVRVLSGTGRVTAYGSVIDEQTQDPTYVPAQQ